GTVSAKGGVVPGVGVAPGGVGVGVAPGGVGVPMGPGGPIPGNADPVHAARPVASRATPTQTPTSVCVTLLSTRIIESAHHSETRASLGHYTRARERGTTFT